LNCVTDTYEFLLQGLRAGLKSGHDFFISKLRITQLKKGLHDTIVTTWKRIAQS